MASHRNDVSMLTLLLGVGANVNCVGFGGQTPLMECCYNGNVEGVKLLINAGADVRAVNSQNASSLHMVSRGLGRPSLQPHCAPHNLVATSKHRVEIIALLLKRGIDPALQDNKCRTALEECIIQAGFDSEIAKVLLKVSPPPQFKKKKNKKLASSNGVDHSLSMLTLNAKDITEEVLIATLKEQTRDMSLSRATTNMISEKALEEKLWRAVDGEALYLISDSLLTFLVCLN